MYFLFLEAVFWKTCKFKFYFSIVEMEDEAIKIRSKCAFNWVMCQHFVSLARSRDFLLVFRQCLWFLEEGGICTDTQMNSDRGSCN